MYDLDDDACVLSAFLVSQRSGSEIDELFPLGRRVACHYPELLVCPFSCW